MKKWICLAVVISMMCYISACGKEEQGDSNMDGIMSKETEQHDYYSALKQYSRNLGKEEGIELVYLSSTGEIGNTSAEQ